MGLYLGIHRNVAAPGIRFLDAFERLTMSAPDPESKSKRLVYTGDLVDRPGEDGTPGTGKHRKCWRDDAYDALMLKAHVVFMSSDWARDLGPGDKQNFNQIIMNLYLALVGGRESGVWSIGSRYSLRQTQRAVEALCRLSAYIQDQNIDVMVPRALSELEMLSQSVTEGIQRIDATEERLAQVDSIICGIQEDVYFAAMERQAAYELAEFGLRMLWSQTDHAPSPTLLTDGVARWTALCMQARGNPLRMEELRGHPEWSWIELLRDLAQSEREEHESLIKEYVRRVDKVLSDWRQATIGGRS